MMDTRECPSQRNRQNVRRVSITNWLPALVAIRTQAPLRSADLEAAPDLLVRRGVYHLQRDAPNAANACHTDAATSTDCVDDC